MAPPARHNAAMQQTQPASPTKLGGVRHGIEAVGRPSEATTLAAKVAAGIGGPTFRPRPEASDSDDGLRAAKARDGLANMVTGLGVAARRSKQAPASVRSDDGGDGASAPSGSQKGVDVARGRGAEAADAPNKCSRGGLPAPDAR